jgi:exonuclease SbcC
VLRRIVLENFMSHSHTVIEPAEGLTILVGPNNCGKSAVVSALQSLCSNLTGDFMVRHGERQTSVTVETDDGHSITWRRKGTTVSYVIDGEEIHRLRGGVPDRVHEILRLPKVSTDGGEDEFDIHFAAQKAPIFLINEPERRAATFFAASSDAARLMQMQRLHTEKVKESKRQRDHLEQDLSRLDRELSALAPIGDLAGQMQTVEQLFCALDEQAKEIAEVERRIKAIARERAHWAYLGEEFNALELLHQPREPSDSRALERLISEIADCTRRRAAELERGQILSKLSPISELGQTAELTQCIAGIATCMADRSHIGLEADTLEKLQVPPTLIDVVPLQNLVNELVREMEVCGKASQSCTALGEIMGPPDPIDLRPLCAVIPQLENTVAEIGVMDDLLRVTLQEVAATERQIRDWATLHPVCNSCGAVVDPERLLSGAMQ